MGSLELSSFAEHCDRVLPGPFVRWLCLLPNMKALQLVNLKQVGTRFLKVVEFKLGTQRARTCFFTTADANYDLRGNGHNIDIVDLLQDHHFRDRRKSHKSRVSRVTDAKSSRPVTCKQHIYFPETSPERGSRPMLCRVFYGKCPAPDYPDHWILFSVNRPSPVRVERCDNHGGPVVLEDSLKEGLAAAADSDRGYAKQEPQPYIERKEELVP